MKDIDLKSYEEWNYIFIIWVSNNAWMNSDMNIKYIYD